MQTAYPHILSKEKVKKIVYGGDYSPEQWPREQWKEDIRVLKEAHIDLVTLNVFNWAMLQPSEDVYDFSKLDQIMELVRAEGLLVCMATATSAHPAWMAHRHPDILRTDFQGRKRKFGGRHNSCPNSPTYRKYAAKLAGKLAERYRGYDNIVAWHISNEYGGECYCENCEKAFRIWLRKKYQTLDDLNNAWNTAFWGHTFYDWEEIVLPNELSEHFDKERTQFQSISLDYRRFFSESMLACYCQERDAIRAYMPDVSVTTNLMGFYKELDYKKWAPEMDLIAWDNYPDNHDSPAQIAMAHDLMRGLKGGKPFLLMEQTPSVTNWLPYNAPKRPGVMRLWSYQAIAHGSDSVLFFQMKQSAGACEKLHGAVIGHAGAEYARQTRVYREVSGLGEELDRLQDHVLGARLEAKIAIYFDWENWWGVEYSAGPNFRLRYKEEVYRYYQALFQLHIPVDFVGPGDSLEPYRVVLAPVYYMMHEGQDEQIRQYVRKGGTFVTTFFSGIADDSDRVLLGGYPARLRDVLGIWVEETDARPQEEPNRMQYKGKDYPAEMICDICHLESASARALAVYTEDYYAGTPAVTVNTCGEGKAYYVAVASDPDFYLRFLGRICAEAGLLSVFTGLPEGLETVCRTNEKGNYWFLMNHTEEAILVKMPFDAVSLLTGRTVTAGAMLQVEEKGVVILLTQS